MASKRPEVLLLVGMSGAGRSASSNVFEDLGYYVIENLPSELVESVVPVSYTHLTLPTIYSV